MLKFVVGMEFEEFGVVFLEVRVEPIFDDVFGPVLHEFGDFFPLGSVLLVEFNEDLVFLRSPGSFFDIRVEDIDPAFADLFSVSGVGE